MDKNLLRQKLKAVRSQIENRDYKNSLIFDKVKDIIEKNNCNNIFTYVSMDNEVDTHAIISYYFSRTSKKVFIPFCKNGIMRAIELADIRDLSVDKHGNLSDKKAYCSKSFDYDNMDCLPDIVLVPLLGFNDKKFRIGYGGGYYDKYLAANKVFSVGLSFDEQYTGDLVYESFDMSLDVIITPKNIF